MRRFVVNINQVYRTERNHAVTQSEPRHEKTNNVVFEQVQHKPSCTSTEDGYRLEILDIESRGMVHIAKTKALISFAVDAKLICAFVFAYAKCWASSLITKAMHMEQQQMRSKSNIYPRTGQSNKQQLCVSAH